MVRWTEKLQEKYFVKEYYWVRNYKSEEQWLESNSSNGDLEEEPGWEQNYIYIITVFVSSIAVCLVPSCKRAHKFIKLELKEKIVLNENYINETTKNRLN
jgi:hypothetical protein